MATIIDKRYVLGEFVLEPDTRILSRNGEPLHLANLPFRVLLYLIENRERLVGRDELLEQFWDGKDVYDDTLRKAVGAIRKAFDDHAEHAQYIETRRAGGYRYIGPLEELRIADNVPNGVLNTGFSRRFRADAQNPPAETATHNAGPRADAQNPPAEIATHNAGPSPRRVVLLIMGLLVVLSLGAWLGGRLRSHPPPVANIAAPVPARSLAVLPLRNLTGDANNDYLSDGITESLINEVSRIETLKIISRSSAFQFKNKDATAQEIGAKLGVAYILEGGVRQSGAQLRVDVRLVNTKDGSVLWASDSEQKKLSDVFAIQDGITCQIVTALRVKLCGEVAPSARYTANVKAYQLYLQGLYYRNRLETSKAIDFFNQALQLDQNYALAHEGLASTYAVMELNTTVAPGTAAPLAELHANKALASDDSLAGAYLALGVVKTLNNYALAERERYYRQALLKQPNHRTAHLWLSAIYTARGEFADAEAEALRAQEIDPLSYGVRLTLADIYFYWRKPDKVIEQAELMLVLNPGDEQAFSWLALAHAEKGDFAKAFAYLEKLPPHHGTRVTVLVAAGRAAEARQLAVAVVNSDAMKNRPYEIAETYAVTGDKEKAFAWLEKSYQMRQANLVSLKVDPALDSLRDDPRYVDLLRRVHLAD